MRIKNVIIARIYNVNDDICTHVYRNIKDVLRNNGKTPWLENRVCVCENKKITFIPLLVVK